jgi:hypothetical protein
MLTTTGRFTKALVELPPGKLLSGAGSYLSFNKWCDIFSKINNVKCVFKEMPLKTFKEAAGPIYGLELGDMFDYFDRFGFDGGDPSIVFQWDLEIDVKYTTMEDYMKSEDWSSVL